MIKRSATTGSRIARSAALILTLVLAVATAEAREKPRHHKPRADGFYLGLGMSSVDLGGTFDGTSAVAGGGSAEVMPALDGGSGNIWIFGYQWDRMDFEMGWESSDHDGTWSGFAFPSQYQSLNFDGTYNWGNHVRPLILYGLGFNSIRVQDGSMDGYTSEDAKFKGLAVRLGGGLHFPVHHRVGIQTQAVYRWGSFGSVDGIVSGNIEDDVNANGLTYTMDARFVFGGKKK